MEVKFYRCPTCGKIIVTLNKKPCPTMCCGKPMEEIIAGTTDAAVEKHVPVYEVNGNTVKVCVGAAAHPMVDVHYIEWVVLQTKKGWQIRYLNPGEAPEAVFAIADDDEVEAVYAYCNLHSLWKA